MSQNTTMSETNTTLSEDGTTSNENQTTIVAVNQTDAATTQYQSTTAAMEETAPPPPIRLTEEDIARSLPFLRWILKENFEVCVFLYIHVLQHYICSCCNKVILLVKITSLIVIEGFDFHSFILQWELDVTAAKKLSRDNMERNKISKFEAGLVVS